MKTTFGFLPLALLLAACQASGPEQAPATSDSQAAPEVVVATAPVPGPAAVVASQSVTPDELPTHPELVVETLDHGPFDLQSKRGGWVVVNFWATWCKPCLKEIPDFTAFDAARDDVTVIGLAYEEIEPDAMRDFLEKHPAGYPIALLDVYDPPADFATPRGLPMTYLIAPDGTVAQRFLGPVTSQDLAEAIKKASAVPG